MTRMVSLACADYFSGLQDLSTFNANNSTKNALGILKVASYFTILIPFFVGLIYGISSLIGRVSVSNSQSPYSQKTSSVGRQVFGQTVEEHFLDPSLVVTTANRILGDIVEINKTKGLIKFSYTTSKELRQYNHDREVTARINRDKEATIAALHQKIAQHVERMSIIIPSPKESNWGYKTFGDLTRTFYTFSQELLDSKTRKVVARAIFHINHTDTTKFPIFSSNVEGKIESEIVFEPFQIVVQTRLAT